MVKVILGISIIIALILAAIIFQYKLNFSQVKLSPLVTVLNKELQIKDVTLESIFIKNPDSSSYPKDKLITIIATGDIIPARYINYQAVKRNNFKWPYEKTYEILSSSDITFANLESPLIDNCPLTSEGMVFCGDKHNIEGLVFSGIDIVNLANNHLANWGQKGIEETIKTLSENNIFYTGINGPVFYEVKGARFAFLGFDDVDRGQLLSKADEENISKEIKEAKKEADIVIVAFHWGVEYTSQPSPRQKYLAYLSIDSGADLVIGNHPHWIQPIEIYDGKVIAYAHGNFVFDQFWSEKTLEGVVGKYTFYGNKLVNVEFLPVQIDKTGQPSFMQNQLKEKILNEIYQESIILRNLNK
jgi:gamma-polyglutamate biosynthesis protein CapA